MVNTMKFVDSFKEEVYYLHIYYKKKSFCKANFDDFKSHKDMIATLSNEIGQEINEDDLEILINPVYEKELYQLKRYQGFLDNGRLVYSPEMFEYVNLSVEEKAKACYGSDINKAFTLKHNIELGNEAFAGRFSYDEDMTENYFSYFKSEDFPDFLWNAIDWEDVYRNTLSSRTTAIFDYFYFIDNN